MKIGGLLCLGFLLSTTAALGETVLTEAQCLADGLNLRQSSGRRLPVHSRLNISINIAEEQASLDYVGHLEATPIYEEGADGYELADYYGIFFGKKHISSKSARAQTYKDLDYFRFKDIDATVTTAHDGGGMFGYLVVSKKYLDKNAESFDAHYVFQSGDHMGGTVDYICKHH